MSVFGHAITAMIVMASAFAVVVLATMLYLDSDECQHRSIVVEPYGKLCLSDAHSG